MQNLGANRVYYGELENRELGNSNYAIAQRNKKKHELSVFQREITITFKTVLN